MHITEVDQLGTPQDTERRESLARTDDDEYRGIIEAARKLIFKEHHAVDSNDVEDLLKAKSLTPTAVSVTEACFQIKLTCDQT